MKTCIWVVVIVIACSAGLSRAVEYGPQTGAQDDWWSDSAGNKGNQFFVPIRLDVREQQFSAAILAGYAYTHSGPADREGESLSHMLDTKLQLSYEILDTLPVDLLIGLDFNLPTGKTGLDARGLAIIMDPDLVSITRFGEGYNINPTLTMTREWGPLVTGLAIGYVWRGKYDFSSNLKDYYPGNILNLNWEARYDFASNWNGRLFGAYAMYDKDQMNRSDFYREGTFLLFGMGLGYSQTKWDAGFTFRSILRSKSKFQVSPGVISTEDNNSHGDEFVTDLSLRYFLSDKTILKPYLAGLWILENGYPLDSSQLIGQRGKVSLGLAMTRSLSPHLNVDLLVRGFFMHDGETHFPEFLSARDYKGFSVGGQLTGKF